MRLFIIFIIFLLPVSGWAQQELSLAGFKEINQSGFINPANRIQKRAAFALPSIAFNYANSGFSYNEIVRPVRGTDSVLVDFGHAINQLEDVNYIFIQAHAIYFTGKYKLKNGLIIGLSSADKINFNLKYPKELPELLWYGNGRFIGNKIDIGPEFRIQKYREWAFNFSYPLLENLCAGMNLKYLQGISDISTSKNALSIYTSPVDYSIEVESDYAIRTTNIQGFTQVVSPFSLKNVNPGFALDIGLSLNTGKWSFGASVLDLGQIKWHEGTSYHSQGSYTYKGLDALGLINGDTLEVEQYLDTLKNEFGFKEDSSSYYSNLTTKTYLTAKYEISDRSFINAVAYAEFIDGIHPAISLSYQRKFRKIAFEGLSADALISYTYKNNSFYNLGMGLSLRYKNIELLVAGDNILSWFMGRRIVPLDTFYPLYKEENSEKNLVVPKNLRNYNLRAAINLYF